MKKSELVQKLRCGIFGEAKTLEEASAYMDACIGELSKDQQGDIYIALGIAMNTLATIVENLED